MQVRQLDWVEQVWPLELKEKQTNPTNDLNKMMYPKVQKYATILLLLIMIVFQLKKQILFSVSVN